MLQSVVFERQLCVLHLQAPETEDPDFRPPSPKYDERTFFMSTQNPWVAPQSAPAPGYAAAADRSAAVSPLGSRRAADTPHAHRASRPRSSLSQPGRAFAASTAAVNAPALDLGQQQQDLQVGERGQSAADPALIDPAKLTHGGAAVTLTHPGDSGAQHPPETSAAVASVPQAGSSLEAGRLPDADAPKVQQLRRARDDAAAAAGASTSTGSEAAPTCLQFAFLP